MKKFPTALTVPRISFRLWLKMAPPLDAIVPALGSVWGVGAGSCRRGIIRRRRTGCRNRKSRCRCRSAPGNALTLTSCDLIVLLSAVVCWAIVAPPRKTMPDSMPASARQTTVSRSECGSLHHAAEQVGHGVERDAEQHAGKNQEQRRGEMPGEQQQGGEQHDADAADRYRPRQIVAGLKAIVSRTCHVDSFSQNIAPASLSPKRGRDQAVSQRAGLTLACPVCQAVA